MTWFWRPVYGQGLGGWLVAINNPLVAGSWLIRRYSHRICPAPSVVDIHVKGTMYYTCFWWLGRPI